MGLLKYYKIDEKKQHFTDYNLIANAREFDTWYDSNYEKYTSKNFIFRGVPSATYELYSSAQRLWWDRDFVRGSEKEDDSLYKWQQYYNFLEALLKCARAWNKDLLPNFYKNLKIDLNDFAMFSFMQHYGVPTPLLDFTNDIAIALYFAFYNAVLNPSDDLLENCVSLYIVDIEANRDFLADAKGQELSLKSIYDQRKVFVFTEIGESDPLDNKLPRSYTNTNFNIINQKGLFLFNYHPWKPLKAMPQQFKDNPTLKEVVCIEFHRSIREHALFRLSHITNDFLFADFNKFKISVQTSALEVFSL